MVNRVQIGLKSYPVDSDGGREGHISDTGVVPSDDASSWVKGWCTRNFDASSKLNIIIINKNYNISTNKFVHNHHLTKAQNCLFLIRQNVSNIICEK